VLPSRSGFPWARRARTGPSTIAATVSQSNHDGLVILVADYSSILLVHSGRFKALNPSLRADAVAFLKLLCRSGILNVLQECSCPVLSGTTQVTAASRRSFPVSYLKRPVG
jgi:hypothetical protein